MPTPFDTSRLVAKQYTQWMYPQPITDLTASTAQDVADPSREPTLIWPDGGKPAPLRILVAGCGTNQAASIAFTNPDATVVGIDISRDSLGHAKWLAEKHALANLTLYECDILSVAELGRQFDYIIATGVVHHMAEPAAGLRALKGVLAPGGVIWGMVYGYYPRQGIYMMQEAFRRLGLGTDPADVALVRETLPHLPPHHDIQTITLKKAEDLHYDSGIVDRFLHVQDQAYTVDGVLALIAAAGLQLQTWPWHVFYNMEGKQLPAAFKARVAALPEREEWAITELCLKAPEGHLFLARHEEESPQDFTVRFDDAALAGYRPVYRPGVKAACDIDGDPRAARLQKGRNRVDLSGWGARLARHVDGSRTVADCWHRAHADGHDPIPFDEGVRAFFRRMWRLDMMAFAIT